jgi:hypothetical protein
MSHKSVSVRGLSSSIYEEVYIEQTRLFFNTGKTVVERFSQSD